MQLGTQYFVITLSVAKKLIMLDVVMLSVVILSVVAPENGLPLVCIKKIDKAK